MMFDFYFIILISEISWFSNLGRQSFLSRKGASEECNVPSKRCRDCRMHIRLMDSGKEYSAHRSGDGQTGRL